MGRKYISTKAKIARGAPKRASRFSNLDFSLDSDNSNNPTMLSLAADTVDLSKASINVNLTNALAEGQTVTLLSAAQQLSLANDKLTINNEKLDSDLSLKIVDDSSKKYVNVADYSLNNASGKLSITANESFITSKYINGDKSKSVEKIDLTNDLSGFKNIYGSYSADNSVAEGGIISINEKVDLSQTTLIGGKATDNGTVGKNTLEISSAAAGSKVNGVSKFSDVNVKLDNAIAEGQTVTLLEANNLELTDSVFTINNKALDSNLSLKFADDSTKKYVSIGEYNLKNSDNKLSISAKESLLTSRYRNGAEDLFVEKFELTNDLNKFKNIYGSYSADNTAAEGGTISINEKVDLSQTALIGGYSASNGEVKNNTLEISSSAAGSKVKGVEKFDNIKFVLASDVSGNTPILSTTDKVVLEGATIDTDLSGFTASDNTSLILLDNTEGKAAKRLINGTEGEVFNAKYNGSFVAINSIGYSSDEDKVAIDVKNAGAGAFIDKDGNLIGKMELTLGDITASNVRANVRAGFSRASEGSDLSGYEDIYGIYSVGEIDPAGPVTVNIVSAIDYSNTVLHGGYKNGNRYAKNTNLIIDSLNVKLKGVTDFESMTFNLPAETKNGDTMLKVADEVDMEPTKSVGVEASKTTGLKAGDSVNLIDSDVGIKNFGTQKITVSGLTDKTGEVKVDDKALVLDINDEKPNKNTKAPVEAVSATMALVNQASALASSKLNKSMIAAVASANGGSATFASMNGGHSKYETGSYVEADSWNIGFGLAKKGMSSKNPDSTYGLFFQYGKSNFDTHNDGGFRGDGDSKMFGAGLTFHQEARSKFYYHGNIYAGKVDAKWNCSEGGYDDDAAYWGMTFGMGRKHNAGGNKTMDVYGRYSFNHVGSMNGDLNGLKYDFDSTSSHNLRLGLRMEYSQKNAAKAYWGLAWEHEFAGDSKATVATLGRTDSPTLNGNTGIAEVGYEWKRGDWNYSINAEGSLGKREGVTGSFNINYNF